MSGEGYPLPPLDDRHSDHGESHSAQGASNSLTHRQQNETPGELQKLDRCIHLSNSGPSSFPKTVDGLWDELVASQKLAITLLNRVRVAFENKWEVLGMDDQQ